MRLFSTVLLNSHHQNCKSLVELFTTIQNRSNFLRKLMLSHDLSQLHLGLLTLLRSNAKGSFKKEKLTG